MSDENGAVPQELLELAERAAAPRLTGTALDRRFGPRSTWIPAPGQIWRAVHEDVTVLVLLLDVEADSVTVVPVTVEPTGEEAADTLVFDGGGTSFGVPVVAWAGLRRSVPSCVLDRPIDDMEADAVVRVAGRAVRSAKAPSAANLLATDLADAEARAVLEDDLATLAGATAGISSESVPSEAEVAAEIDLDTLGPEALDEIAARLGVQLPVVLDLIDGKRPPTPQETTVLREVLGAAPTAAPPPPGLVVAFSQPRWRGLVRQRRRRDHLTEAAARGALIYEVNAVAARQTGDQEPSWHDRIRRWADAHGLDPDAEG